MSGTLYVVATPIGNRADISARAIEVLSAVDLIAAEDTRHSRPLLKHYGVRTPLQALHEHNERQQAEALVARLKAGESIALISDAGTPLISDPGFNLVRAARAAGVTVVPVPGPSALIAALSAAGLPTDRFVFEGFLPSRPAARRERLAALAEEPRTLVFYESSHRIADSLADMRELFGAGRPAAVARELSKAFEEIQSGTLEELLDWLQADPNRRRGEFVVLVHGAPPAAEDEDEARRVLGVLLEEMPLKKAAALAARLTGQRKNRLYQLALEMTAEGASEGERP
ncbi:16S rRNA (cytidine(1402)-2'-O)-methyltransferase [Thiohalobacter sp. IOR34]|uniref:16S rRNA (cytidine(1402)-2'-O)-methyltransferase n=1 Tax=Thiohalobacter sp. IOR34 TaxID=3057176 RepID=UPI0025B0AC54|nr:16S rRNA (cytidine(1402)-2'-O)-methyltransferase [Thiohalobacter sp. IOR34]WJW74829.1 16S rRNA (cytidine(1402)-2'-O)-methyltransferase [Thiohalobacter sp. IOR34]